MGAPGWVCLVTSRRRLAPDSRTVGAELTALQGFLDEAIAAGIDLIQIREPDVDAGVLFPVVERAAAAAAGQPTRIVVNDRADLALAAGAHGVHLPAAGMPAARVRELRADWLVGRSVHAARDVLLDAGVDYFIFGTVFPSASKPGDAPVAGVQGLADAVAVSRRPVLAIGGITPERAEACVAAGAAGVAAIGVFLPPGRAPGALGPAAAAAALRESVRRGSARREARDRGL